MEDQDCVAIAQDVAVVALPARIDIANAGEVRRELTAAVTSGADVVIVNMTGTSTADASGVHELVLARSLARVNGAEFRVVLSSPNLLRVFADVRLDGYLQVYRTLEDALMAGLGIK
jgi:anti-anti-sigma factor